MYPVLTETDPQDAGLAFPGWLYLPGEPVPALESAWASDTRCDYCDNPMTEAGSADIRTGNVVTQYPMTGTHDGIVSSIYCPVPGRGLRVAECGWAHLRCVTEAAESGMVTLTVGHLDPVALAQSWQDHGTPYGPRHVSVA